MNNKKKILKNINKSYDGFNYIIPLTPSEEVVFRTLIRKKLSKDATYGNVYLYRYDNIDNTFNTEIYFEIINGVNYYFPVRIVEAIVFLYELYDLDMKNYVGDMVK